MSCGLPFAATGMPVPFLPLPEDPAPLHALRLLSPDIAAFRGPVPAWKLSHHAQTKPDALVGLACPELACRLRADLPAKRIPSFGALGFRLFTHGETPLSGG